MKMEDLNYERRRVCYSLLRLQGYKCQEQLMKFKMKTPTFLEFICIVWGMLFHIFFLKFFAWRKLVAILGENDTWMIYLWNAGFFGRCASAGCYRFCVRGSHMLYLTVFGRKMCVFL